MKCSISTRLVELIIIFIIKHRQNSKLTRVHCLIGFARSRYLYLHVARLCANRETAIFSVDILFVGWLMVRRGKHSNSKSAD